MFRSVKGLKPFFWRRTIKNTRRDIFSSSKIAAQKYAGFALTRFAVPVWSNYNKGGTVLSIKSDLASEIIDGISEENLPKKRFHRFGGVDITEIEIAPGKMEELFSRPAGKYITMEAESILDPTKDGDGEIAALAAELSSLLPKKGTVLAVGIGNEELAADSLGAKAIGMMTAGSFLGRRLCCLSTGVCGKTGFSPPEMISSVIAMTKPRRPYPDRRPCRRRYLPYRKNRSAYKRRDMPRFRSGEGKVRAFRKNPRRAGGLRRASDGGGFSRSGGKKSASCCALRNRCYRKAGSKANRPCGGACGVSRPRA